MKKVYLAIITICAIGLAHLQAQTDYAIFAGPSHFMRLNEAGNDFVAIDNNEEKGNYIFYHSYLDQENPWSVVSEGGTNIYTRLNFKYVSDFRDVFMISPEVNLSTSGTYTFSQALFGMLNKEVDAGAIIKIELQLLEGKPGDFAPEMLSGNASLKTGILRENTVMDYVVENIVPQSNGAHYFVVYFSYLGYVAGNAEGVSLGFKKNQVINTYGTALNEVSSRELSVYPNPCTDNITIEGMRGELKIYNLPGVCVKSLDNYQGEVVDVSDMKNGIYLIQNEQGLKRFVKR